MKSDLLLCYWLTACRFGLFITSNKPNTCNMWKPSFHTKVRLRYRNIPHFAISFWLLLNIQTAPSTPNSAPCPAVWRLLCSGSRALTALRPLQGLFNTIIFTSGSIALIAGRYRILISKKVGGRKRSRANRRLPTPVAKNLKSATGCNGGKKQRVKPQWETRAASRPTRLIARETGGSAHEYAAVLVICSACTANQKCQYVFISFGVLLQLY